MHADSVEVLVPQAQHGPCEAEDSQLSVVELVGVLVRQDDGVEFERQSATRTPVRRYARELLAEVSGADPTEPLRV